MKNLVLLGYLHFTEQGEEVYAELEVEVTTRNGELNESEIFEDYMYEICREYGWDEETVAPSTFVVLL